MFEAQIKITLKKTVADPQGLIIKHALESLGFGGIGNVRVGKFLTIQVEDKSKVNEMCEKLLANPIIEDYTVEIK
ncbi:MAG: phosphoribosylformylglycinamidine synthase subunit PurS [bacterium]